MGYWLFSYAAPLWLVLIGLLGLSLQMRTTFDALRSRRWARADGLIRVSEIAPVLQTPIFRGKSPVSCRANVVFEFEVNGQTFTGKRICFTEISTSSKAVLTSILHPYPVGASVTVFYDPEDPTRSVLQPGLRLTTWLSLSVGCTFVLMGILWAIAAKAIVHLF